MPVDIYRPERTDRQYSLGWLACAWIEALVLHGAGDVVGMPVILIDDHVEVLLDCYALEAPGTENEGRRLVDEYLYLAAKGSDKSGLAARVLIFDAIGPSRFAGWAKGGEVYRDPWGLGFEYVYEPGEPMGRSIVNPHVRCMATAADQSSNTYETIYYNFTEGPLSKILRHRDDAGKSRILLPGGGKIEPSTAAGSSKDGGRETCANADETHLLVLQNEKSLYTTVMRNLRKRKKAAEPFMFATSTFYDTTQNSICQEKLETVRKYRDGKLKHEPRMAVYHRYGDIEPEDLQDEELLKAALEDSYGGALLWMDVDGIMADLWSATESSITDLYRYYLNTTSVAANAWLAPWEWSRCGPEAVDEDGEPLPTPEPIQKGDVVTLGFDGSRKRARGYTDATALVACRVSDGATWPVAVFEQPPDWTSREGWEVPTAEVDAAVREAFATYNVVAFYADPALWQAQVAQWEAMYAHRVKVKTSQKEPFHCWMIGGTNKRTIQMIKNFEDAVLNQEVRHFDDPTLTSHILHARRKESNVGYQLAKDNPESPRKIDAAVAAVMAWQARLDAVAQGLGRKRVKRKAIRIR